MYLKLLLILFEIGFGLKFNIVGSISAGELFLIAGCPFYLKKALFNRFPELKKITWLYIALLSSQIVSEIIVGNNLSNASKGLAVTIVSYLHFIFLFSILIKDRKLILYVLIGIIAQYIIFGTEYGEDITMNEVMAGEGATFLKFYLVNFISSGLLISSIFFKQRIVAISSIFLGLLVVVLGARSSGLGFFIMGLIPFLILGAKRTFTRTQVIRVLIIAFVVGYGAYVIYINQVLAGNIKSGNSSQTFDISNPYNPINLLIMGRSEAFVGWTAFMDSPLFGHGAWTPDPGWKYHILQTNIQNNKSEIYFDGIINTIPSHSVLIGTGVNNGILAFFFIGTILWFFLKKGIKIMKRNEKYLIIIVSFVYSLIWNGLFSPVSHFRITLPVYFAMIYVSYIIDERKSKINKFKKKNDFTLNVNQ